MHSLYSRSFVLSTALLLFSTISVQAQDSGEDVAVQGFVRASSNGQALQGANAVLRDMGGSIRAAAATDDQGIYQISAKLGAGRYRLQISFVGYQTYRDTLRLEPGERRIVSVSLTATPRELEGVTVEGRQSVEDAEAGLREIRPADIATVPTPGPGSDLASYLRSLPGVTTTGDRGGRLYVRGGRPSQNLVLVDGIPIYKPFHVLGFYSAFPGDIVSSADFYAGGFGAEYTERISSVLDVNLRTGNTEEYEGSIGGGPFLGSLRAEGPLLRGSTSFLVRARHSLIERTGSSFLTDETPYKFYDVAAKIHTQSSSNQCSFVGLRTYDRGRIDPASDASIRWTNTGVGGQCLLFGERTSQILGVNFGTTRFNNAVTSSDGTEREAGTWRLYANFDLQQPVFWGNTLRWTAKVRADQYNFELDEPTLGITADDQFLITGATHVGAELEWGNTFTVNPSIGAQFPISYAPPSVEPRLRLSYRPNGSDRTKFTAAGGLYHQFTAGVTDERDAGSSFQILLPTPFKDRPSQAIHALLGWDQQLWEPVRLSVEGWFKDLQDIPVPRWTPIVRFNTNLAPANGTAFGADVSLQYNRGPVRLTANYGYGQLTYRAAEENLGAWVNEPIVEYSPPYDLRHKLGLSATLDTEWGTANARWQYSSGLPFTSVYGFDTLLEIRGLRDTPLQDIGTPRTLYQRAYDSRLPPYHRLDVSFERTITLSATANLVLEAGAINAYDRTNVFYVDIFTLDQVNQLSLLPYLSFEVNF